MANERARKSPPCPICGKPVEQAFRPFCSKRCAEVDLQRWLSESYTIPSAEDPESGDEDGEILNPPGS